MDFAFQDFQRQRAVDWVRERDHVQRIVRCESIAESVGAESDLQTQIEILRGGAEVFPAHHETLRQAGDAIERSSAIVVNGCRRVQMLGTIHFRSGDMTEWQFEKRRFPLTPFAAGSAWITFAGESERERAAVIVSREFFDARTSYSLTAFIRRRQHTGTG